MEDINENLGYLISKASRMIKWRFNNNLKEYNLTAVQWSVIKDISIQEEKGTIEPHDLSPALIAERLYMDRPTMSGILERAVINGWVERQSNPEDRRSQVIRLTEKSKKKIGELNNLGNEIMELAVAGFTEQEVADLKKLLLKMIHNVT